MRAAVIDHYGPPESVELRDVDRPELTDDGVMVRVQAASVNPADWYEMRGKPYVARVAMGLLKPKQRVLGIDFAGTVEAVGTAVTQFRPGDEVFGGRSGAFAEYVCVSQAKAVTPKPPSVTFEQAASVPVAAVTALQGLRDHGHVQPGQHVLINGASGGVGTFAVQIAKALGAEVTGVCRTRNVDLVRSIGADHVIDYTHEDFTAGDPRYDLMLDIAGSRSWPECTRVLTPKARFVLIGAPKGGGLLGPLGHVLKVRVRAVGSSRKVIWFVAKLTQADLASLGDLLERGKVTPVIDRRYELSEITEALRYMGEGHAQGKIVVTM